MSGKVKLRGRVLHVRMCNRDVPYGVPMAASFAVSVMHHYLGIGAVSVEISFLDHATLSQLAKRFISRSSSSSRNAKQSNTSPQRQQQQQSSVPAAVVRTDGSQYHSQRPAAMTQQHNLTQREPRQQPQRPTQTRPPASQQQPQAMQRAGGDDNGDDDCLVCVICCRVATLPSPVFGGCLKSTLEALLPQQLRPPFTIVRCLEVASKLAHCNATKDAFSHLRLVRIPHSARWVPAMVPPSDTTSCTHASVRAYLSSVQHAAVAEEILDPFVEVPEEEEEDEDDGEDEGHDGALAVDELDSKVQDRDVVAVNDRDAPAVQDVNVPLHQ